jgi:hypothetical protein
MLITMITGAFFHNNNFKDKKRNSNKPSIAKPIWIATKLHDQPKVGNA